VLATTEKKSLFADLNWKGGGVKNFQSKNFVSTRGESPAGRNGDAGLA